MGGLSVILLAKGRERTVWMVTFAILIAIVLATAGEPHRRVVDGKEIVEAVILGHVVSKWPMLIGILLVIGVVRFVVDRLLNRLWPEKGERFTADKVYERPDGGFVAWRGDDPESGSPLDYVVPRLRTALDYLQAEGPAPMRVLILGSEGAEAEDAAFHAELARWRREASEETIQNLVPAARTMGSALTAETVWRLTDVSDQRGIPTLDDLSALADELDNEDLKEYVAEKRSEGSNPD